MKFKIIDILDEIQKEMHEFSEDENSKENKSLHKIAFYQSQAERASNLSQLLENDVINHLIGLNNLAGPIKNIKEKS